MRYIEDTKTIVMTTKKMNISRDTSKRTGFFLHVAGIKAGISLRSTVLIIFQTV